MKCRYIKDTQLAKYAYQQGLLPCEKCPMKCGKVKDEKNQKNQKS